MQKDRYEILGPLGFGATSRVDKARDKIIGRTVAIKTLVHSFGAAPQQKQFLREAQIVGQLSHPAIVNLFDVGIIHGDVKPANIMITEEGEVKLSDFGIARFATQVSGSGRIMGTPAYLSPEQIMGEPHSTRSDLFSLGIVLYQMLTGVPPFDGSSVAAVCAQILTTDPVEPSRRNPALPSGLDHIVMRCLSKKPEDRYPTGDALAASLYPLGRRTAGQVQDAPPANLSWWSRPIQSRDVWAFASVILLAGGSVPAGRAVVSHFRLAAAPAAIASFAAPKAPEALAFYAAEEEISAPIPVANPVPPTSLAAPKRIRTEPRSRISGNRNSEVARAVTPAAHDTRSAAPAPVLALPVPAMAAVPVAIERAALRIKIDANVTDGTLAIFADHDFLLTTGLRDHAAADPAALEKLLPAGPHQLRVALYRADKSLQTEKEGLGELRADSENTLVIRVTKRPKMLVRRETALEVIWPSAISPQRQPVAGSPSVTTALK